jgi:hypothetical protein
MKQQRYAVKFMDVDDKIVTRRVKAATAADAERKVAIVWPGALVVAPPVEVSA